MKNHSITVSAPGKIHLLGEHTIVYGKPALLAAVDLRVSVILNPSSVILNPSSVILNEVKDIIPDIYSSASPQNDKIRSIIEPIIKKYLKIKAIPPYQLTISSQIPVGSGLGSSAAISVAYIAALLSFLKVKWDLRLINKLAFEAEKVFHGNPSGGDNSTVVFGGLVWFRKESPPSLKLRRASPDLKIIQSLNFTIPPKLAKNFILVNTGKPKETTKQMVEMVSSKYKVQSAKLKKIFDNQEQLVRDLLPTIRDGNENQLIQIIRAGERNLEAIGVVSPSVKSIIRKIEKTGGAAKICGAGGKTKATGVLLAYHKNKKELEKIAKSLNLPCFRVALGAEGLKNEK